MPPKALHRAGLAACTIFIFSAAEKPAVPYLVPGAGFLQGGYGVCGAQRLMYPVTMYGAFPEEEGGSDMLFLAPDPGRNE